MEEKKPTNERADPEFNSAIAYLQAIRSLKNRYHELIIEKNLDAAYYVLKELKTEVYPRQPSIYDSKVKPKEDKCDKNIVGYSPKDVCSFHNMRKDLFEWMTELSVYIHKDCKLEMTNKDSEKGGVGD